MSKKINIKNKTITIYDDYDKENIALPVVFYNTFSGNGESVWEECKKIQTNPFIFVVVGNVDWDNEMTPWVEGPLLISDKKGYDGLAKKHLKFIENDVLKEVLDLLKCNPKEFILSGYSLGGLFSVYSIYNTKMFSKFVSCSGSLWYPNFIDYVKSNKIKNVSSKVYLSLGNKEKDTKDITNVVEDRTREFYEYLKCQNINTTFEINDGNHFKEMALRMAKGIKWILK